MINYLLEVTLYQFVLLAVYHVGFKRYTFFQVNRFFLLFSVAISFVLPFLSLPESIQSAPILLPEIVLNSEIASPAEIVERTTQIWNLDIAFYVGLAIFASLLFYRLVKLYKLISSNPKQEKGNFTLVTLKNENEVFSWFNYVFAHTDKLSDETLSHELVHIKNRHSIDILFLEFAQVILWFSPVVHWYKHELQLVHEYQADEHAVKESVSSYAKLLVNELFQVNELSMVHNFWKVNQIKSRIKMLKKMKTHKIKSLKYLLVLPLLAMFTLQYSCTRQEANIEGQELTKKSTDSFTDLFEGEVYNFQVVDKKPELKGLDQSLTEQEKYMAFQRFIMKHVKDTFHYPVHAKNMGIQGRVVLGFVFGEDGNVRNVKVLRGVNKELDAEAVRIISSIPEISPAYHKGQAVPVSFMVPITFKIKDNNEISDPTKK